jgi:two-component system response regulator AtoC
MAAPTILDCVRNQQPGEDVPVHFLVVLGPETSETRLLPASGRLSIGRDEGADVRIVDALASRAHAHLHLGATIEIEDLGSANGTRLRDQRIPAHQRVAVSPGEAISIGTTVLLLQRKEPALRPRRIWPHGYFETRLGEACAQAEGDRGVFAVVRLHTESDGKATRCEQILVTALRPGNILASYGPDQHEILLVDTDRESATKLSAKLVALLESDGIAARAGVAYFPADGTSPQALVSIASGRLRGETARAALGHGIVLENPAMRDLYSLAEKVARGTINVLILGETGVGKEILAEMVHQASPRSAGPFVCMNCAALSDSLLESELFGYEKGAFTGALQAKIGLLEAASSGTLFLDEIGEMSLTLQAKVLRAIETRQVLRVGSTKPRSVDVRFVAATNRDLEEEVAARRFRKDLYFRLNGVSLSIPPLRERIDELPALAELFLETVARQVGQPAPRLTPEVLTQLCSYSWPGNLRELRNVMERALLLSSGNVISLEHLPLDRMRRTAGSVTRTGLPALEAPSPAPEPPARPKNVPLRMAEIEKQAMLDALIRCAGNQTRAS